tara:strand:- start:87 stop:260 length:174 start_codon:yes stop_codon:yes gene_type:complete
MIKKQITGQAVAELINCGDTINHWGSPPYRKKFHLSIDFWVKITLIVSVIKFKLGEA